jgi:hypothetical protein
MTKYICAGALMLSILASVAVLPVAVVKLAEDIRTLVTLDFRAVTIPPR